MYKKDYLLLTVIHLFVPCCSPTGITVHTLEMYYLLNLSDPIPKTFKSLKVPFHAVFNFQQRIFFFFFGGGGGQISIVLM